MKTQQTTFLAFFIACVLLILTAVCLTQKRNVLHQYWMRQSMTQMLLKPESKLAFEKVATIKDVWTYANTTLRDAIWNSSGFLDFNSANVLRLRILNTKEKACVTNITDLCEKMEVAGEDCGYSKTTKCYYPTYTKDTASNSRS